MKKFILLSIAAWLLSIPSFAQDEPEEKPEKEKGFQKEKLFTGGSLTASFFTGGTVLGINPHFGYQLAKWVDAGIVFNYTYAGRRDEPFLNDKIRQHVFGPGAFVRIYPVRFIFLQAQYEHNFIHLNYTASYGTKQKFKYDADCMLVGAGLAQGRDPSSNTFFYISVLVDVIKDINSPYVNNVYDENTGALIRTDLQPIIRGGVNIGLFEGRRRR